VRLLYQRPALTDLQLLRGEALYISKLPSISFLIVDDSITFFVSITSAFLIEFLFFNLVRQLLLLFHEVGARLLFFLVLGELLLQLSSLGFFLRSQPLLANLSIFNLKVGLVDVDFLPFSSVVPSIVEVDLFANFLLGGACLHLVELAFLANGLSLLLL